MHIRKIKAGGVNTSWQNFVGEIGTLFYDQTLGNLRISDGHTPGGHPVIVDGTGGGSILQSDVAPGSPSTSTLWYDTVGGRSYVYYDSSWVDASPVIAPETPWQLTSSTAIVSLKANGQINLGSAQEQAGAYTDVVMQADSDTDSFAQIIHQNHNTGTNASTDIVLMNDQGDDFNNFIDLGINSSNYSQPSYSVTGPGDGYLFANGADLVIGTQSPNKKIKFHAGGTVSDDAVAEFDQYRFYVNRRVEVSVSTPSALNFLVSNSSNNVEASASYKAENNIGNYIKFGVNSNQRTDGNIGPGETFMYTGGVGDTMHIGNNSTINFYANTATGYSGTATLQLSHHDQMAMFAGNIFLPNGYILGAAAPIHSYGAPGDRAGMVAFDASHVYYCTANYVNTSTNIWKRVQLNETAW